MRNGLYIHNIAQSVDVEALREVYDGNVITTRFLDGTTQVQTFGASSLSVAGTVHANKTQCGEIYAAYFAGAYVSIWYNNTEYIALITQEPVFEYAVNEELNDGNKYFSTEIIASVKEVLRA